MDNNQKFIKRWEKTRKKGKFKFMLTNFIIYSIVFWITSVILIVIIKGKDFYQLKKQFSIFIGCIIGFVIGSPINWVMNEKKYNNLLGNNQIGDRD